MSYEMIDDNGLAFLNKPVPNDIEIRKLRAKELGLDRDCIECFHPLEEHWDHGGCPDQWCSCERAKYDISPLKLEPLKEMKSEEIAKLLRGVWQIVIDVHIAEIEMNGMPKIFHLLRVAGQMTDLDTLCVALLHEACETSGKTIVQLCNKYSLRLPIQIQTAVRLLTHKQGAPYLPYLLTLKQHEITRQVKFADVLDDFSRLVLVDSPIQKALELKYRAAIKALAA